MLKVRLNRDAIQLAMVRRNMSQNMLAIRVGISSGYISQLMCGTRYASPRVRQKILDALTPLTFDDVFIIEEDKNAVPAGR
ncbi:MAG TPA: helix-turn-helix transcriptional regulator [Dehalococcoidia bacterium]|nr:helix-turn-helix transcriptional regulator [Dehalococcoidia bacterium]